MNINIQEKHSIKLSAPANNLLEVHKAQIGQQKLNLSRS